jgi:DNA-binding protein H-NS
MATNGRLSDKQVTAWFETLGFERQQSVLNGLTVIRDMAKNARIQELKRELAALDKRDVKLSNGKAKPNGKGKSPAAKYREPTTGETWSGRGRMANWLTAKQKAGEKITKYLVK